MNKFLIKFYRLDKVNGGYDKVDEVNHIFKSDGESLRKVRSLAVAGLLHNNCDNFKIFYEGKLIDEYDSLKEEREANAILNMNSKIL